MEVSPIFNYKNVPSFTLLSKSNAETVCATILLVEISEVRGSCSALQTSVQLNLGSVHCESASWSTLYGSIEGCFHSLIVKYKSSFTVTNSTGPVGLLHSFRTMAFPVECVELAIVNDVVVSAPIVNSMLLVGGDMFYRDWERSGVIYTTGATKYELSSYDRLIRLTSFQ